MTSEAKYWHKPWNPAVGCTPASEGCVNCWAKSFAVRGLGPWKGQRFNEVRLLPERLAEPLRRRTPTVYFGGNMTDLFHESVPFEYIAAIFGVMAECPQHTFLLCTKRAERMERVVKKLEHVDIREEASRQMDEQRENARLFLRCLTKARVPHAWPLPGVWLGVTAENQRRAKERVPDLQATPAAHRWISYEPGLGEVNVPLDGIDLVIAGGESGSYARLCDTAWLRSMRDQCKAAGVGYFCKQLGSNVISSNMDDKRHAGDAMLPSPFRLKLRQPHGSDPSEWTEDLNVRQLPWRL